MARSDIAWVPIPTISPILVLFLALLVSTYTFVFLLIDHVFFFQVSYFHFHFISHHAEYHFLTTLLHRQAGDISIDLRGCGIFWRSNDYDLFFCNIYWNYIFLFFNLMTILGFRGCLVALYYTILYSCLSRCLFCGFILYYPVLYTICTILSYILYLFCLYYI